MDILSAAKKARKSGKRFYFYYDDGSRSEYEVSRSGLLLNSYGEFAHFDVDRLLSGKFTFSEKKHKL